MRFCRQAAIIFKRRAIPVAALAAALVTLATAAVSWAGAPTLRRITQGEDGGRPLTGAYDGAPAVSANGRYVAFVSDALNFGPVEPGTRNVFVKDRITGSLELVNRTLDDRPAGGAYNPAISADGRFVAFTSGDGALTPNDPNGATDVFVRDRQLGLTQRMSVAEGGGAVNGPSGYAVALSADGRFVAFTSYGANLVPGDVNGRLDVFIRDRQTGVTERISPSSAGAADSTSLDISANGRYVAYSGKDPERSGAEAAGLYDLLVFDRDTDLLEPVSVTSAEARADASSFQPSMSADGRYVVFTTSASLAAGGMPSYFNVYVRDRLNGTTALVSQSAPELPNQGVGERGVISPDGRFVAFTSNIGTIIPGPEGLTSSFFVRELSSGIVRRGDVSTAGFVANWWFDLPARPSFSGDGRYLCFESHATNLDPADQHPGLDLFVRDLTAETTTLISTGSDGAQGVTGAESSDAAISADGSTVAFRSNAHNLISNDHNQAWDVFVTTRAGQAPELISVSTDGVLAEQSTQPFASINEELAVSGDGRFVVFSSAASNLVGDDHNGLWDVFVRDRMLQTTIRADVSSEGVEANGDVQHGGARSIAISADGRYVVFASQASNLVAGDTNNAPDIFVRDLVAHTTECVSVGAGGVLADSTSNHPAVSSDGRFVVFSSYASNLASGSVAGSADLYVRDRVAETTTRLNLASNGARVELEPRWSAISGNGRYVAFVSRDAGVVPGDINGRDDVFVRDLQAQSTERVSLSDSEEELDGESRMPSISDDGRFVSFRHEFGYAYYSVLVRDRLLNSTERADVNSDGGGESLRSLEHGRSALSGDGRYLAFASSDTTLDPARAAGAVDVLVRDRGGQANAPENLTASVEDRKIRIAWLDQSDDETGFRIERRVGEGEFELLATVTPGTTTYLDEATEWEVTYTYRVVALSPYGNSPFSNEASAVVPSPVPTAPTGVTATVLSQTSIRLDWQDRSETEAGFSIERSTNAGATFTLAGTVAADQETFTDTGLTANTTYVYRVKATHAAGSSPYSSTATARTLPNPPAAPVDFYVARYSDTQLGVSWNPTGTDVTGFELERKAPLESYQPTGVFPAGSTGLIDAGLLPNQTYFYRLRAFNTGGNSAWVEYSATTGSVPAGKLSIEKKLDFGTVRIGKSGARRAKARNLSKTESLRISVDDPAAPYTLGYPSTDLFIASRGVKDIWFNFRPTVKGKKTIKVRLVSSDPKKPTMLIILTGRGK